MKGRRRVACGSTRPEQGERLRHSEKDAPENVMIVDMVRKDLGRIATPGSVCVTTLFERCVSTVLQLTSTVNAESSASLTDVMAALFRPRLHGRTKPRTMDIIAALEGLAASDYTGTIGFIEPSGRAQFNVAIRTI